MTEHKAPGIWIPGVDDVKQDLAQYADAQSVRKPHGHIFVNGQQVADTLMCCHCNGHFIPRRGSGIKRGFCMRCMEVTCGRAECRECRPFAIDTGELQGREF